MKARREGLGLAQGAGGVSSASWRKVEKAIDPPYRRATLVAICRALRWTDDSIDELLDGGQPTEATNEAPPWELLLGEMRNVTEAVERLADRLEEQR